MHQEGTITTIKQRFIVLIAILREIYCQHVKLTTKKAKFSSINRPRNAPSSSSDQNSSHEEDDHNIHKKIRKRKRNSKRWNRNKRHQTRISGKSYLTTKGKAIPEKIHRLESSAVKLSLQMQYQNYKLSS